MVELYACLDMLDGKDEVLKDKVILKISSQECLLDQLQELLIHGEDPPCEQPGQRAAGPG